MLFSIRTGMDDDLNNALVLTTFAGSVSCSHRWVPSRMTSQKNGLPQSGFVDDRRRCRVRGSVHARVVDRCRHAPSAPRWNVQIHRGAWNKLSGQTNAPTLLARWGFIDIYPARSAEGGVRLFLEADLYVHFTSVIETGPVPAGTVPALVRNPEAGSIANTEILLLDRLTT